MADKRKNIVLRFGIVYTIICLSFVAVLYKIVVIQTVERSKWLALADKNKKTEIVVRPNRGNIYACDGRLMASSIPTYYIFMDMRVPALHDKGGKLFKDNVDSLALCLSAFLHDRTPSEYKTALRNAYREGRSEFLLYPKRISYAQLKELKRFPLFWRGKNKSGLITKELFKRVRPFGSLASRTIGDIYADENKGGRSGLEMYFNKDLVGTPGLSVRQKIANSYLETVKVEPIDGMDVNTTLDVDIQDICEKNLIDSMKSFDANSGYVILMEVHSGEVKAIVNMQKNADGTYSENRNGAVSDQAEPGSTFKVMSVMAALDQGKIKLTDVVQTGNGIYAFANRLMRDHNADKGGFGTITVAEAIHGSSNVGISKVITEAYGSNPSAFVDKLYQMKLNVKFNLEIPGASGPRIRHPHDKNSYWSATTLPWMSIGYETQIPPVYTMAYFNAIANDGKYIQPMFVKSVSRNGQVVKSFNAKVINPQICKPSTLKQIREMLLGVIEGKYGTAKNMKSRYVRIAGKTGTAQISKGANGYKEGGVSHQVSFAGYFPADNPLYTAVVVIREPHHGYPSGGRMAGSIFKTIAEEVMALRSDSRPADFANDSLYKDVKNPHAKKGYYAALNDVLSHLQIPLDNSETNWVEPVANDKQIKINYVSVPSDRVPDLTGMGAKDAVYLCERLGLNVQLYGIGHIVKQSLSPGTKPYRGTAIRLDLEL